MEKLALVRTRRHQNLNQHGQVAARVAQFARACVVKATMTGQFEIQKYMVTTLRMRDNRSTPAP